MRQDLVESVARAWASIDGRAERFESGKINDHDGHYEGYMAEADELLKRSGVADLIERQSRINEDMDDAWTGSNGDGVLDEFLPRLRSGLATQESVE